LFLIVLDCCIILWLMALPRAAAERRFHDLERAVAAQRTGLEELARHFAELSVGAEAVRADQRLLQRDHASLCSAIQAVGVSLSPSCSAAAQRQRRSDCFKLLQTPELALLTGAACGVAGARNMSCTSMEHGQGFREVLPMLRAKAIPDIYVCGGARDEVVTGTVERFVGGSRWETLPPMPTSRCRCATASIGGKLYVFGGRARGLALQTVECFDPLTMKWLSLPNMTMGRDGCAAVANSDGYLYVFGGGLPGAVAVDTAERYHPPTGRWEVLPSMLATRDGCVSAACGGFLYVFGGYNGCVDLETAERYDPENKVWQPLPPMSTARDACATAACGGKLYVFGGYGVGQALFTAECFDPRTMEWTSVPDMPTARDGCAATAMRGKLYVFGGYGVGQALAASERFDPETNSWERLPPMPTARDACCSAAVAT